jgi:hypothetical protein
MTKVPVILLFMVFFLQKDHCTEFLFSEGGWSQERKVHLHSQEPDQTAGWLKENKSNKGWTLVSSLSFIGHLVCTGQ